MPNSNLSFVAQEKIADYLLSTTHAVGKAKAKFFSAFGFDVEDADTFRGALIQHSVVRDVNREVPSPFGVKYTLVCEIQTPDERNPCIVTVWIINTGTNVPKLITAYPE
ncbi:MAG: hypothetical protein H7257_13765 [Taibaiella sp.]|nr:hypothetical protein [Taibaiella sp.]